MISCRSTVFIELVYVMGNFSDTCTVSNTGGRRVKISLQIDRTGSSADDASLDDLTDANSVVCVKRTLFTSYESGQCIEYNVQELRVAISLPYLFHCCSC